MNGPTRKMVLILTATFLISAMGGLPYAQTSDVGSLRAEITSLQDSLTRVEKTKSSLSEAFEKINQKIYDDKKTLEKHGNFLVEFRLRNQLKKSREIADRIAIKESQIESVKSQLQYLYQKMIGQLNAIIQKRLKNTTGDFKPGKDISSELKTIQELEKEKSEYYDRLQAFEIDDNSWQKIEIEPGDGPDRIRMKISILQDKLRRLQHSIEQEGQRLKELKNDRSVYEEMQSFYTELNQSIEAEQDFFDRDRVDELKDRVDEISSEIRQQQDRLSIMKENEKAIRKKVERFYDAAKSSN